MGRYEKGIEDEAKTLGVSVDIFASPSEGDFQSQLQLFEDLSNKNYKGIAFAPLSSVNLVMPVARAWKKGIYLVNLDEKIDMDNLKKQAVMWKVLSPPIMLPSGRKARHSLLTSWVPKG